MKKKILIVVADYYENISTGLIKSAINEIQNSFHIKTIHVPGVFEIPVTISKNINKFNGFIALGCIIKGKTPHFEFISRTTLNAIMNLSIKYNKPIGNGIITSLNKKQALERANRGKKNKGVEAVVAALTVLNIFNKNIKQDTK